MKKFVSQILILAALSLVSQHMQAQSNPPADSCLQKIAATLPPSWEMHSYGNILKIECMDSVWIIAANHINGPGRPLDYTPPTDAELKAKCIQYGRLHDVAISYRLEPKWDAQIYANTAAYNDSLWGIARNLSRQPNIQRMNKESLKQGKSLEGSSFAPKTKADTIALRAYLNEIQRLAMLEKPFPSNCTEKYSLFRLDYDPRYGDILTGLRDDDLYPARILDEHRAIMSRISETSKCKD